MVIMPLYPVFPWLSKPVANFQTELSFPMPEGFSEPPLPIFDHFHLLAEPVFGSARKTN